MCEVYGVNIAQGIGDQPFQQLLSILPYEKQKRINRFKFVKDAERSLVAELLIRYLLNIKGFTNGEIHFQLNPSGKPFLQNVPNIAFNLSHSENWVVCALDKTPVGIDVEHVQSIDLQLANQFFTDVECHYIFSNSSAQLDRFYEIWTMKESYIKARGHGLSIPLDSFSITALNNKFKIEVHNTISKYNVKLMTVDPKYKLALCSMSNNTPAPVTVIPLDNLITNHLQDRLS
ncbi:4'-phosphopantetheinyl transferase superfamily protein [Agaribacter marinus]|uniref:4'-phosphopantetheinyl transferase superfamily protein n=1 Tax=Virgibacillus salarius TaxID=447199 RepID=A0A941ICM9_9BACI|nr:4'-phosphopantetheinyl transferase superfamily protein [Virgibacillus salarius]MBR7796320.1 4'-phosphopantetheinyl transferase superfamily protein [Virgibacillus salarius]NAZ09029.1 4'-phosphopantetheinyl transferase superfamily protein [Agaribacter marinus]